MCNEVCLYLNPGVRSARRKLVPLGNLCAACSQKHVHMSNGILYIHFVSGARDSFHTSRGVYLCFAGNCRACNGISNFVWPQVRLWRRLERQRNPTWRATVGVQTFGIRPQRYVASEADCGWMGGAAVKTTKVRLIIYGLNMHADICASVLISHGTHRLSWRRPERTGQRL